MKIKDVVRTIEEIAPIQLKESWDNTGLMIGDENQEIGRVLFAMDVTKEIVEEAIEGEYSLIVTHHPLFFKPVNRIDYTTPKGKLIASLIRAGIAVYSAHTNFDAAHHGVSEILAHRLGLQETQKLDTKTIDAVKHVFLVP